MLFCFPGKAGETRFFNKKYCHEKRSLAGIVMLILVLSAVLYSPNCKKQVIKGQDSASSDLHGLIKVDFGSECYDATSFDGGLSVDSVIKKYDSAIRQIAKQVFESNGIQFTNTNYKKFTSSLRLERAPRTIVTDPCDYYKDRATQKD